MDIMGTPGLSVVESREICGEEDMTLILKVVNLKSEQKEMVNKLLDASDQCKGIIHTILSSTNTMLELVQKILRADTEELNLMRRITELNSKEWDLFSKILHLCDGKKYFICKFMDWYFSDESLDSLCSCSGIKGKNNRSVRTNEDTSTEKLDESCRENVFSLSMTDICTENRSGTKELNLAESNGISAESRSEEVVQSAQPVMRLEHLLCYERPVSGSSKSSEDVCGRSVSHAEHSDLDLQLNATKQLGYAKDEGDWTSAVSVSCGTSSTRGSVTGAHEELLLNTKSALPLCENTETRDEQTLVLGTVRNCFTSQLKERVEELLNVGMKQARMPELPKQNMGTEVHGQQVNNKSFQGNVSDVLPSPLLALRSTGLQLQNDILPEGCFPVRHRAETQRDLSGVCFSKPSEEFVLKDCYIRLENMAHVLRGKKTVNVKDLESPQGNRMEKSISANEATGATDCRAEGSSAVSQNTKGRKDTGRSRYLNNAKQRGTQTSGDLGFQEGREPVLRSKETVNLKDLERCQGNVMKGNITENERLTVTSWVVGDVGDTLLNTKRKRNARPRCYTNKAKKRIQTFKGLGSQVIQNRESAELTTNGNIQTEVSTDGPQLVLHLQPMLYSVSGPQVIVSSGSAEFFTNGSQVSLYHKSVECLSSGLQVPASHEQSVCVATGGHLEQRLKITTCDSMSSDTNFVFPRDVVKENMVVEGHSEFESLGSDQGKTCFKVSTDTASNRHQNGSREDLSTVQLVSGEGMPEDTEKYRHQHRVPAIQNRGAVSNEEGSYESVGKVLKGNAEFMGKVEFRENSASRRVEKTSNMRLRVKPEFSERTGILWRPLFGEAKKALADKEDVLGIPLRPLSLEQVGSLKWAQFTTCIDHPYAAEKINFVCTQ